MENREFANFIDELKRKNDIVEVASLYCNLKQKGKDYSACCPFHSEKTPSFHVNQNGQYYKCFGCGVAGDVIRFVQEIEHLDFIEAVKLLAKRVNMTVPDSSDEYDAAKARLKKQREKCFDICLASARFYNSNLYADRGRIARDYLLKRGISLNTATVYGLGYSPDWDALPTALKDKQFQFEECAVAGVLGKNQRGGYYDALGERLIVPIINSSGQVIAFGGRVLVKRDDVAKYKNTGETPIFEKGKNLFGLNIVKKSYAGRKIERIVIVEGYMDVIALYQYGFNNVVASMGTSLTKDQARQIKRVTEEVVICYDGDSAGQNATVRGLQILQDEGLHVLVAVMPQNVDPDELVRSKGADAFQKVLLNAQPLSQYRLALLARSYDLNSANPNARDEARRLFVKNAIQLIRTYDAVEQESYLRKVALTTGFSLDLLKREVESQPETADNGNNSVENANLNRTDAFPMEIKALCFVLKSLLYSKPWAKLDEKPSCLGENSLQKVIDYIFECKDGNVSPVVSRVFELLDVDVNASCDNQLLTLLIEENEFTNDNADEKYYNDCVNTVRKCELSNELEQITAQYNECGDAVLKRKLAVKIAQLGSEIKRLI